MSSSPEASAAPPSNRLAGSTSPYLLQHQHNPVDWHPWGEEAASRARAEDKPIFLSIGYSACHWCHVMERESFESPAIAELLNRDFISIKVDREERPDLDEIYMTATQLMTQAGGWPMSVFLTPDLRPFYAGTYFPPEDRWGRPGFPTLLTELARAWRERRDVLEQQADRVCEAIDGVSQSGVAQAAVQRSLVDGALREMQRHFDPEHGGFGSAPKFPPSMRLELILRRLAQGEGDPGLENALTVTLDRMARGGMYDQVAGGFHRYSVDEEWLVPHFEKMLYDNALLARVYALGHVQTGNSYWGRVGREILDYVLREMTGPEGGFYSATDADSEGEEGKFFVWEPEEVRSVLGEEDGALFCRAYDIRPGGNFEGHSIPNLLKASLEELAAPMGLSAEELDARLRPLRERLWRHREGRIHPLLDDKVLTGWNGLMIRAMAEGYRVFQEPRYREAAERAAHFCLTTLSQDGRLLRSYREGRAHLNAYLEDYSYLAVGLLDLHSVTGEERWREEGLRLVDQMDALFHDEPTGTYYFTSHDHEQLITRVRSIQDGATPSPNSMAALALLRAAALTGRENYRQRAARLLSVSAPQMAQHPAAFPNMLVAVDEFLTRFPEGVRVAGADAVRVEALLSRTSVAPGESLWIALRLRIQEGYHLNSNTPRQEHLSPTVLVIDSPDGFELVTGSYPEGVDYAAPFSMEGEGPLSVYSGTVLLGVEAQADTDLEPGVYPFSLTLRMQPCDDRQCYPPMEAQARLEVRVGESGRKQFGPEVAELVAQAERG